MSAEIRITLPDGSVRSVPAGTTARAVAEQIGPRLAKDAVAAQVNGEVWALARPTTTDEADGILTSKTPEALHVPRHSAAHTLAPAGRRLDPARGTWL